MNATTLGVFIATFSLLVFTDASEARAPKVLEPTAHCGDYSSTGIATFADLDLEQVLPEVLSGGEQEHLKVLGHGRIRQQGVTLLRVTSINGSPCNAR